MRKHNHEVFLLHSLLRPEPYLFVAVPKSERGYFVPKWRITEYSSPNSPVSTPFGRLQPIDGIGIVQIQQCHGDFLERYFCGI